jgi:uncharacterized membrane protein YhiD involved in acid resistance
MGNTTNQASSSSSGAAIGIGVGITAAVVVLIVILFLVLRSRRHHSVGFAQNRNDTVDMQSVQGSRSPFTVIV